jgi:hypothetical protein
MDSFCDNELDNRICASDTGVPDAHHVEWRMEKWQLHLVEDRIFFHFMCIKNLTRFPVLQFLDLGENIAPTLHVLHKLRESASKLRRVALPNGAAYRPGRSIGTQSLRRGARRMWRHVCRRNFKRTFGRFVIGRFVAFMGCG